MKNFKPIYLLAIILIFSCSEDDNTDDPTSDNLLINDLGFLPTDMSRMPLVMQHLNGERIVTIDNNEDGLLDGLVYTNGNTFLEAKLDSSSQLPTSITTRDNSVFLFAYKNGNTLMDIAIVRENSEIAYIRDVAISLPARMVDGKSASPLEAVQAGLFAVGTALSTVACVTAGGALVISTAGLAIPAAVAACGGLIIGVTSFINTNTNSNNEIIAQLDNVNNVYSVLEGALGCATGNWANCASGVVTSTSLILTQVDGIWNTVGQGTIALANGALISGYGEIKITLTWDSISDIDLWVTDPTGEKIYYAHPQSASGGFLDFDDIDGFGPENIFWENVAPSGSYLVQVHNYDANDAGSTKYLIQVEVQGIVQFYNGTLITTNDVNDVVSFQLATRTADAPVLTELSTSRNQKKTEIKSKRNDKINRFN